MYIWLLLDQNAAPLKHLRFQRLPCVGRTADGFEYVYEKSYIEWNDAKSLFTCHIAAWIVAAENQERVIAINIPFMGSILSLWNHVHTRYVWHEQSLDVNSEWLCCSRQWNGWRNQLGNAYHKTEIKEYITSKNCNCFHAIVPICSRPGA